jgi:hypothetical protein
LFFFSYNRKALEVKDLRTGSEQFTEHPLAYTSHWNITMTSQACAQEAHIPVAAQLSQLATRELRGVAT